jgi:exopolyphosphatase/guanosine-5'-triphosphate,3'-diphosphate pyrophosphatase
LSIEALAKLAAATSDENDVGLLPVESLRSAIDLLSRLSFSERVETLGLKEDRADVILPAALVYHRLAELANVETILIPGTGVAEGILLDLVQDLTAWSSS